MAYAYRKGPAWYIGYRDENGEQRQVKTAARSKTEAKRLAEERERFEERVGAGLEKRGGLALTLGELWIKWSEAKSLNASADTDEIRWRVHLKPQLEAVISTRLTPVDLEVLLHAKLKEKGGDLSIQSVRHLRLLVGRMYRWGIKKGLNVGNDNPAGKVELPQLVEREPEVAAPGVVEKLLATAPEPYRTIYAIAIYAGLRSDEILGLQREQIDLTARVIIVSRQGKRESTKNRKVRGVPIAPVLLPLLEARVRELPPGCLLFSFPWKQEHWRQHILRTLYRLLDAAKLPRCTVHELRHTFITQLAESGADPRAIQHLAGQASLDTTQRYTHLRSPYLAAQMAKLDYSPTQKEAEA